MSEAEIAREREREDIHVSVAPASWTGPNDEIVEGWLASSPGVETVGAREPDEALRRIADKMEESFRR